MNAERPDMKELRENREAHSVTSCPNYQPPTYTFDDYHLGITVNQGKTVSKEHPRIARPLGLTNSGWYKFCNDVIKFLGENNKQP